MEKKNLYKDIPKTSVEEIFDTLFTNDNVKIERIISTGQSSKPDFWYDQDWDEWVLLLKGQAVIGFEHKKDSITLQPGDYLLIPRGIRHRVEFTIATPPTVWLAIHMI